MVMGKTTTVWPRKTREMHSHHFDSTIWNDLKFRDDDIIVSTYGKSGTTWTQQIVAQMLFGPDPDLSVAEMSPWLDLRVPPKAVKLPEIEAQTHRRIIKTHLPVDALVFSPQAKYLYIGRDARDVVWSLYNHFANANDLLYSALNDTPGLVGPRIERPSADLHAYWQTWFEHDGFPFWSFWDNARSWWAIRDLPNVLFIHFNDLKQDMPAQMRRIAQFLDIEVRPENWPRIIEYCTFDWMKNNATRSVPMGGAFWDGGAEVFINKGVNGRWRDVLTDDDCRRYEARAVAELGEACAHWLMTGA
jgi:aryl sulfotransferase